MPDFAANPDPLSPALGEGAALALLRVVAGYLPNSAIFIVDRGMRYLLAGGPALGFAGFTPSDLEGKTVDEVVGPDSAGIYRENFGRALGGEAFSFGHFAHGRHLVTRLVPLGDASGRTVAALAVSCDVTDRVDAELEDRLARDALEVKVAERTAELRLEISRRRELALRLETVQEDERRRVSRDLHDSVGQVLAALGLAIKAARGTAISPATIDRLEEATRLVDTLGREVHDLAVRLRPTTLDDFGLEAALGQLVGEWSDRVGVRVDYSSTGIGAGRLPEEIETTVFRVVQEALTNVVKHALASLVSVTVVRPDAHVKVVIEDDGVGFDPSASSSRLGLAGIRERVELVGGSVEIESSPGGGTSLAIRIPIPAALGTSD